MRRETNEVTAMTVAHDFIKRIFSDPPILETSRLLLRRIGRQDVSDMYEYSRDSRVTKYLLWDPHPSRLYTARYIDYLQVKYRAGEFFDWAVVSKKEDKMIGTCGFTRFDRDSASAEIGYVLNPEFWGRGIALEAARLVMHFGFSEIGLDRIEARYMVGNDRSQGVIRKLGMTEREPSESIMLVKGQNVAVRTNSILRREYVRMYGI